MLLYLTVQVLMLVVIVKFGNPLEEDMKVLIVNKLRAVFHEAEMRRSDSRLQF